MENLYLNVNGMCNESDFVLLLDTKKSTEIQYSFSTYIQMLSKAYKRASPSFQAELRGQVPRILNFNWYFG